MTTLIVLVAVVRVSVATDRLFFKGKTGGGPTSVRAAVGESIVLECEAGGSSTPTIHWLRHGRRIEQVRCDVESRAQLERRAKRDRPIATSVYIISKRFKRLLPADNSSCLIEF